MPKSASPTLPPATCIVPIFNEEKSLESVLSTLIELPFLQQIICVDDCSSDHSAELISTKFPKITLIQLSQNVGKSAAVKVGLDQAEFENILLFDADLKKLKLAELTASYQLFLEHKMDMLILGRHCRNPIFKLNRGYIVISGERWVKKTELKKIFAQLEFQRFVLELAINYYHVTNHKRYFWVQTSCENTNKHDKYGLINGAKSAIVELIDICVNKYDLTGQFWNFKPNQVFFTYD